MWETVRQVAVIIGKVFVLIYVLIMLIVFFRKLMKL